MSVLDKASCLEWLPSNQQQLVTSGSPLLPPPLLLPLLLLFLLSQGLRVTAHHAALPPRLNHVRLGPGV